ncbi:hypothetical protein A9Q84_16605 [Halobacteriovorax marinus]|uniref:HTH-type transcriptional regulator SarZ n=1 Tax=Halobacteriovorax marinus TaxID=97084 RepID=A0A1Y5F4F0_9BACT|nr:hypothetical protein A9Q84_16605 [Halobacteriovorax marinus]
MKIFQFQKNSLIYSIYHSNKLIQNDLGVKLKERNLTFPQSLVLASLFFEKSELLSPKDLEYSLDFSKSALSQTLSQLEGKKFIKRKINEDDARSFTILLTQQGKKISAKMVGDFDLVEKKIEKNLENRNRKLFLVILKSIRDIFSTS